MFSSRRAAPLAASLAIILACVAPATAQHKYALLIGINQYKKHPDLRDLKFAENDANELKKALELDKAKKNSGFDEVVVMTQSAAEKDASLAPTAANVREQLKKLEDKMEKGDV